MNVHEVVVVVMVVVVSVGLFILNSVTEVIFAAVAMATNSRSVVHTASLLGIVQCPFSLSAV